MPLPATIHFAPRIRRSVACALLLTGCGVTALPARTWYVDAHAPAAQDGGGWKTAFQSPGEALSHANRGDEVWCRAGEYVVTQTVSVASGVTVRGGFTGREATAGDREHVLTANATVVRQQTAGQPVLAITEGREVVIDGLTLTGTRDAPALELSDCDATIAIRQCAVVRNRCEKAVPAIAVRNGSRPTFFACKIADNDAAGGLLVDATSRVTCEACVFSSNRTVAASGGAVVIGSRAGLVNRFIGCDFYFNEAGATGSAIATAGEVELRDSVVCSNRARAEGEASAAIAIHDETGHLTLSGKTYLVANVCGENGRTYARAVDAPERCTSRDDALIADQTGPADPTIWTQRNDVHLARRDLFLPPLTSESPGPGKWVKQTLPSRAGTAAYHGLYLPTDWQPGRTYPVLVGFPGNGPFRNRYGDRSGGLPEDNDMAFGISGGHGFIILALGYLDSRHNLAPAQWWWGDVKATVAYCKDAVAMVCKEYGGDPTKVILTGFSRSAIGVGFIGLHDDTIARLWRGFICYDGWETQKDMARDWYKFGKNSFNYDPADFGGTGVERRFRRVAGRPVFILGGRGEAKELNEKYHFPVELVDKPHRNHNTSWAMRDTPERAQVRAWLHQVVTSPPAKPLTSGP